MIKEGQKVKVSWHWRNKEHYINQGYIFTKYGDKFQVDAKEVVIFAKDKILVVCDMCNVNEYEITIAGANKSNEHVCEQCMSTRNKISVTCHTCQENFESTKTALNKSKSGYLFCSNACVGKYNAKVRDKKVEKHCEVCGKTYQVKRVHAESSVACSVSCQNKWQSTYLVGVNANNYKGGARHKRCKHCGEVFHAGTPSQYKTRVFCSLECKHENWIANTLNSPDFDEKRFEGILWYRKHALLNKSETKPERMVREYFESVGLVRDVHFFQEDGFLGNYFSDFHFPKDRTVIEVMGDYWHGNPEIYGDDKIPLSKNQIDRIEKDIIKKRDFLEIGYTYIEIWEKDIYENVDKVIREKCLKHIPVTTTRRTSKPLAVMVDEDIV